jgi:glutamate mutase epsilon subunit
MTELETLARAVASEIVNQTIWKNYKFYLLVAAISLVSSALVAFCLPYFKRRGENLATKADFNEILRQLKQTTTLTESIKSDMKAKLEEEHSVRALTREKMEALMIQTFDLELWFERARSQALEGNVPDVNVTPMAKIEMYQAIYFRELENEVRILSIGVNAMLPWIMQLAQKAISAKTDHKVPNFELEKFGELHLPIRAALSALRKDLIKKYASKVGL